MSIKTYAVAIRDAMAVSTATDTRRLINDILKTQGSRVRQGMAWAIDNADTEVSHYAAVAVIDALSDFRKKIQVMMAGIRRWPDNVDEVLEVLSYIQNILDSKHIAPLDHLRLDPVYYEADRSLFHRLEQSYYPVSIPHRRNFRCSHYQSFVSSCSCIPESRLYACRAVYKDIIKFFSELLAYIKHLVRCNRILGP